MGIIVKFVLKNICEKKFRTFLILISIMLSSALFFASNAMSGTMVKMFENRIRQFYGSTEIVVVPNEKSPSRFFSTAGAEQISGKLEYSVGLIQGSAAYRPSHDETVNIQLYAFNIDELQKIHPVEFYSSSGLYPFEGRKIILSKAFADKYGLKQGDTVELNVGGIQAKFKISSLAYSSGLFLDESQTACAVVPLETLASIYNARGRVNMICMKTLDPSQKQAVMNELADIYSRYTVKEPFTLDEIRQQTSSMNVGFMLMSFVVTLISIFIIYTSFKVVTMERLPVIGTFRSIGATRKTTDAVLIAESLIYGITGGASGCLLGVGILYVMAFFTKPVGAPGFHATIAFTPGNLASAFAMAVILSFASCILPIIKISRIPVKDIILNIMQKAVKKTRLKFALGMVLILTGIVLPLFIPINLALPVNSLCMFMPVAGIVLLVPYFAALIVKIFEWFYVFIFGNIGILAAKNLRENKSILNNISLLAIGISSLLMINTISSCVFREVTNVYRSLDFGIWMSNMDQPGINLENVIRQTEGVSGTYGMYEAFNAEMEGLYGGRIMEIQGVNQSKYLDYWKMDFSGDAEKMLKQLENGRNIIITNTLKDKYGLKAGDILKLRLGKTTKDYRIIGFINTLMDNGSLALISETNLIMDTGEKYYSNIYVKTSSDAAAVMDGIKKHMGQRPYYITTVSDMEDRNNQSNESIFVILKGFSILAMAIGVFGILNNLMISFIERRRSIAMLRSVGMNRRQTIQMIFIEALSGGIIGGISGSIAGFMLIWDIPFVLKAIDMSVTLTYPFGQSLYYIAAGALITIVASISPALKTSRMNIIEAVKYE